MTRLVSIDGTIHKPEEATVSVYDRGFLYGDSVFETLGTYGGEPLRARRSHGSPLAIGGPRRHRHAHHRGCVRHGDPRRRPRRAQPRELRPG